MARLTISGLDALKKELRKFPDAVQARAVQTGVRKAAGKLRTAVRRAAYAKVAKGYKRTNRLRYALRSAVGKRPQFKGKAWVALKAVPGEKQTRHYYKVLEVGRKAYTGRKSGRQVAASPPMKPFFQKTVDANSATTLQIVITETLKAIAYEAGKALGRSKRGR
jgi:hypothetical protein